MTTSETPLADSSPAEGLTSQSRSSYADLLFPAPEAASQETASSGDLEESGSAVIEATKPPAPASDAGATEAPPAETSAAVPWDKDPRWIAWKQQEAKLEKYQATLTQLEQSGLDSDLAIQQAVAQTEQREFENALAAQLQEQELQGLLNRQQAQEMYNLAVQNRQALADTQTLRSQLEQALARQTAFETKQQLAAAKTQYPEMDEQYVTALAKSGAGVIAELAKASHDSRIAYKERILAEAAVAKAAQPAAPESSQGIHSVPSAALPLERAKNTSWRDLLRIPG